MVKQGSAASREHLLVVRGFVKADFEVNKNASLLIQLPASKQSLTLGSLNDVVARAPIKEEILKAKECKKRLSMNPEGSTDLLLEEAIPTSAKK